jgi:hypothetical protein
MGAKGARQNVLCQLQRLNTRLFIHVQKRVMIRCILGFFPFLRRFFRRLGFVSFPFRVDFLLAAIETVGIVRITTVFQSKSRSCRVVVRLIFLRVDPKIL